MTRNCNRQLVVGSWRFLIICCLLLSAFSSFASNIGIITKLDTNQILIGDQVKFSLEVLRGKQTEIVWPDFGKSIQIDSTHEIEILSFKTDTISHSEGSKEIRTYILTVFDSGYYVIPPASFKYRNSPGDSFSIA